jgi:hypothetical protein
MNNVVSILSVAHAQATCDQATKPVFVGTVWIIDESEEVILAAANMLLAAAVHIKDVKVARATQNLQEMHAASGRYRGEIERAKRAIGQAQMMATTLSDVTGKHVKLEAGR